MNKRFAIFLLFLSATFFSPSFAQTVPQHDHVVVCVMENHSSLSIVGSIFAPYINSLISGTNTAHFTESFGLTHPSQPNYLMLFSGSNQGVTDDDVPGTLPFTVPNLGASLIDSGFSFIGYSEDIDAVGSNVASNGHYARKHNPWVNWQEAPTNGIPTISNQPYTSFPTDFTTLPTLSFVIPNQVNDMHNPTLFPPSITNGDTWLENNLDAYIQWAKTNNSLFILTFDEDDQLTSNHIVTLFIGENVIAGDYNEHIDHYNILRTLEDMYGLPYAGSSATATPITDCWAQITTGISLSESSIDNALVYPNPAIENLNIEINNDKSENIRITISNMFSQIFAVYEKEIPEGKNQFNFPLQSFETGTYFVNISSSQKNVVKKIIVRN
jgi:phosphatidylinositol-3-phosphatase